ncbi:hypothetical protein EDB87DRAFT_1824340 [Lactarius vividus]|nr:hypothetical protein EDB87DRAFT_1824340 [Lactarius vividus]
MVDLRLRYFRHRRWTGFLRTFRCRNGRDCTTRMRALDEVDSISDQECWTHTVLIEKRRMSVLRRIRRWYRTYEATKQIASDRDIITDDRPQPTDPKPMIITPLLRNKTLSPSGGRSRKHGKNMGKLFAASHKTYFKPGRAKRCTIPNSGVFGGCITKGCFQEGRGPAHSKVVKRKIVDCTETGRKHEVLLDRGWGVYISEAKSRRAGRTLLERAGNYWAWWVGKIKVFWFLELVESSGVQMAARKRGTTTLYAAAPSSLRHRPATSLLSVLYLPAHLTPSTSA